MSSELLKLEAKVHAGQKLTTQVNGANVIVLFNASGVAYVDEKVAKVFSAIKGFEIKGRVKESDIPKDGVISEAKPAEASAVPAGNEDESKDKAPAETDESKKKVTETENNTQDENKNISKKSKKGKE